MTTALAPQRVRLSADGYSHSGLTCRMQDSTPRIWEAADLTVEIGPYMDGVFVDAVTGIQSVVLDVLASQAATTVLLRKTILAAALTAITEAEWTANTAAKVFGKFELTKADTSFDMTAAVDNVLTLWLVIYAIMSDGKEVPMVAGQLQVERSGKGSLAVGGTWGNTRISPTTGLTQVYVRNTAKWHTIVDTYVNGVAGISLDQTGES
jgi:hypothetical protein